MTTHYGDYKGFVTTEASAYPISYSGAGLFDMSPLAEELMDYLPSYFYLGNNNRRILELIATVLKKYSDSVEDFINQLFVETATWGLQYWEQLVGCPVSPDNLDYASRRVCILNKLRDCSSEECFVEGMEAIISGQVTAMELPPNTNPYQIRLDLRSDKLTYIGPDRNPIASVLGEGPLVGDYTYRVTYEFEPVVIPDYITLFPYTNVFKSQLNQGGLDVVAQRHYLEVDGTGSFYLVVPGVDGQAGPFTENSTAEEVSAELKDLLQPRYGESAVSSPFDINVIGQEGIILVYDGPMTNGLSIPVPRFTSVTGSISGSAVAVNNPQFVPQEVHAETPSGVTATKVNEVQILGPGLYNPALENAPVESDLFASAEASMAGAMVYAEQPTAILSSSSLTALPSTDSSVVGTEYFNGVATGVALGSLTGSLEHGSAVLSATGSAQTQTYLVLNPPISPIIPSPITGGTFNLAYNTNWDQALPPVFETTVDLPYNAPVLEIKRAIEDLPSIYPDSIYVYGGPLPSYPVFIEFRGPESGFPQSLLVVDSGSLVGGFYETARQTAGSASYTSSESNTVAALDNTILLSDVPVSPDGASRRNIYRKKTEAPYNEWRYVGSIDDNYTTIFVDDTPDEDLSETQLLRVFGSGTYRLRYDSYDSTVLTDSSNALDIEDALNIAVGLSLGFPFSGNYLVGKASAELSPSIEVSPILTSTAKASVSCLPATSSSVAGEEYFNAAVSQSSLSYMSPSVTYGNIGNSLDCVATASTSVDPFPNFVTVTPTDVPGEYLIKFDKPPVVGKDVPQMEIVATSGITGYVLTIGPRALRELSTAFTYEFQRLLEYIYVTKPAHLRVRELRSAAFRASINAAGDPV